MTAPLHGKAVVVTGAGRGLGEAYVRAITAAGGAVVVNDVDADQAERVAAELGDRAVAHPADITSWDEAEALISRCVTEFGAIDGLVNNAGVFGLSKPEEQRPDQARLMLDVNVFGAIACGTHALRHMVSQRSGVVLNVTSGEQMGNTATAVYGATKAAVATLTYSWAQDVCEHGIRVNAVSPNAHTRMADVYQAYRGEPGSRNVGIPPEVNAPLVVYLLSDLSSVTGQVVRLSGDELMLCTHPAVLEPTLRNPNWTVDAIAEAFDSDLNARQQPSGVHRVRTVEA